jgi:hypothetical protein
LGRKNNCREKNAGQKNFEEINSKVPLMRLFAIILLIGLTGCSPHVNFVVPDGFRGTIFLIADPTNGVAITKKDGLYTVKIPSGGKLRVQDLEFLERWHHEAAHFANGTQIPSDFDTSTMSYIATNVLALCGGTAVNDGSEQYHMYFVGTRHEYDTANPTNFAAP